MKDQYFGDINDYRKYGLLRILSSRGNFHIGVCWMLTGSDGRADGKLLGYLQEPKRWRNYDPELFDYLSHCLVIDHTRNVRLAEDGGILPATLFYTDPLTDHLKEREKYFERMLKRFKNVDLIFFDPDNGLEVKSKPIGQKYSCKYLYWPELVRAYELGHSVLVYQHFSRERRTLFIQRIIRQFRVRIHSEEIYPICTPRVVFFLAPQRSHSKYFRKQIKLFSSIWPSQIFPFCTSPY